MLELLHRYNFEVFSPTIISGDFKNMELLKIVTYADAVKIDNSLPNIQTLLGYTHPENKTYYIFAGDIVVCKDWIDVGSLNENVTKYNKQLTLLDIDDSTKTVVTQMLDSLGIKYTEGV